MYGHYDSHLKEAYERRDHPNLFVARFEDFKSDHLGQLTRLNAFIGAGATEAQLKAVR